MWWVWKTGVSFYDDKNNGEEALSMSVTMFSLDITSYNSMFLEILWMGLGVDMVVSVFLLRGAFLVKQMLDCCACMWNLNVAS